MEHQSGHSNGRNVRFPQFQLVLWILTGVLAINVGLLFRSARTWELSVDVDDAELSRRGAYVLADFFGQQAARRGLEKNQAVRDSLARLRYEIAQAVTVEDVGAALSRHGMVVEAVLRREQEEQDRRELIEIISRDPGVAKVEATATIIITKNRAGQVVVEDPDNVLTEETKKKIVNNPRSQRLTGMLTVQVTKGRAAALTSRSLEGELISLRQENQQIKAQLQEVQQLGGFAPITGPGLIVRATVERVEQELVGTLDYDVRDMVNELFAAGARGIEIGGQRLIATSSIRTVGDRLLVNQQPVGINPLELRAVGDPQVLASSLDLLRSTPFFGLKLQLEKSSSITLGAYRPRR